MRKMMLIVTVIWISGGLLSACTTSKAKVFGTDMPSMKTIHDNKFHKTNDVKLKKPDRLDSDKEESMQGDFMWLPNPTLSMYVFKHLTPAGHPVPGYSTFFRMYTQDHIAIPSEQGGWE
ncbi:hypothetical protein [Oceanicoccus sp. KOV_DT_Chl]|uniref:hypothetical protein n=1 Tax=Oceanicoccus sp. KOV_DT_Chl TaxID=1904639 RepID=UPI000C7E1436|nr:hypothetical protein [Oceanicoccus sp. KOV_DT_Chl]